MKLDKILLSTLAMSALFGSTSSVHAWRRAEHGPAAAAMKTSDGDEAKFQMSAKDLKQRLDKGDKVLILDARAHLGADMIKGATHVPVSQVEEWAKTADKKAVIVTYCTCPHDEAADSEMKKLREMGFQNAFSLSGGLDAARATGIQIVEAKE